MIKYKVKFECLLDQILHEVYQSQEQWDKVIELNPSIFNSGDFIEKGTVILLPQKQKKTAEKKAIVLWGDKS